MNRTIPTLLFLAAAACGQAFPTGLGHADSGADAGDGGKQAPGQDAGVDAGADAGVDAGQREFAACVASIGVADLPTPPDAGYLARSCSASSLVLAIPGRTAISTELHVRRVHAALEAQLLATQGVVGVGEGLCCGSSQLPPFCLQVILQTHTTSVDDLASALTASVQALDAGCLGVEVSVVGLSGPRCDSSLQSCQPVSMCTSSADPGCCPNVVPYRPGDERFPFDGGYEEYSDGICEGDGDCFLNGCGNHCTSTDTPGFIAPCPCLPALSAAHCGCVAKKCQWFTQ